MNRLILTIVSICFVSALAAQPRHLSERNVENFSNRKTFNWGIQVGLNALSHSKLDVQLDEISLSEQSVTNKVGYSGKLFFQLNLSNFVMQPEIAYLNTTETIRFSMPDHIESIPNYVELTPNYQSLMMSVFPGYNIIDESPFLLTVLVGPSVKYNFKTSYKNETTNELFYYNSPPKDSYELFGTVGIAFGVSRFYVDFRYSVGIMNSTLDFNDITDSPDYLKGIRINQRSDILNFSCGLIF